MVVFCLKNIKHNPVSISKCLNYSSGPSGSKQMTSLVNVLLKFQTYISQIRQYFLLKKCEKLLQSLIFSTKNFSVFGYKVVKHLTS